MAPEEDFHGSAREICGASGRYSDMSLYYVSPLASHILNVASADESTPVEGHPLEGGSPE